MAGRLVSAQGADPTVDNCRVGSSRTPVTKAVGRPRPRRLRPIGIAVATVIAVVGVAAGFVAWTSDNVEVPVAPATAEEVLNGCSAATTALAAMGPAVAGRVHDRLADVVPDGMVEQYRVGYSAPASSADLRPWFPSGALEGYVATFNDGPPGPGGWTVSAFRFPDAASAGKALRTAYTGHVCRYGADPWRLRKFPGAAAASTPDAAWIYWTSADLLVVVDWSVYQELGEARTRAESAATAVRAALRR